MTDSPQAPVVTIDGPSGTGKGTVATLLAQELGWHYLDSGALYRAVGWAANERGVPLESARAQELGELARAAELMQVCVDYERELGHPDAEKRAAVLEKVKKRMRDAES